jgi:hypothetical protein
MRRAQRETEGGVAEFAERMRRKAEFKAGKTGFKTGIHVFKTERQALRSGINPITTPAFLFESFASSR